MSEAFGQPGGRRVWVQRGGSDDAATHHTVRISQLRDRLRNRVIAAIAGGQTRLQTDPSFGKLSATTRSMATSSPKRILDALEALAEQLSVSVRYEPMTGAASGTGGLCRVRGEYRVIIDRRLGARERLQILSAALGRFDLTDLEVESQLTPFFPQASALTA